MYQVMIIDDEEPVLESFAFILQREETAFTLCGKARSGAEALQMIPELSPDLVFMDIQMPGIDGLEVIRQIRPQFPNIVFVLATAYERFDIAQKAVPLGIFSYLVKPISKKKLLTELGRAKKHLDQLRDRELRSIEDIQLLQKTKSKEKNLFLRSLMWRNPEEKDWEDFLHLFNIKCERGAIYIIDIVGDLSEKLRTKLYETVMEKIQYKYNCLGTIATGKNLLFFPEEHSLNNLSFQLNKILKNLKPYSFTVGEGGVYPLSSLHSSFSEAFHPFVVASESTESTLTEREQVRQICNSILDSDNYRNDHLFENYWNKVFTTYNFQVALGKMVALFTIILSKLDYRILSISNFNINPAEEIMVLRSVEEWHVWSSQILKRLKDIIKVSQNQSYPGSLTAALAYIHRNYQKPLQLSLVAEDCNITGSYLSRLFSEHLGTTFIDYINRYRMNKAIILLKEKKYSIKEISYLVGYQDPNYFSRIFRRHMGFSPSDLDKERTKK